MHYNSQNFSSKQSFHDFRMWGVSYLLVGDNSYWKGRRCIHRDRYTRVRDYKLCTMKWCCRNLSKDPGISHCCRRDSSGIRNLRGIQGDNLAVILCRSANRSTMVCHQYSCIPRTCRTETANKDLWGLRENLTVLKFNNKTGINLAVCLRDIDISNKSFANTKISFNIKPWLDYERWNLWKMNLWHEWIKLMAMNFWREWTNKWSWWLWASDVNKRMNEADEREPVAGMNEADKRNQVLTWGGETSCKGVPGITEVADADGTVTDHSALCVYSTRIRAGWYTLLIDASKILWALAVHNAFGSTIGRVANKIRETSANGKAIYISAITIWSTGGWAAWVCFWQDCVEKNIITYKLFPTYHSE